MEIYQPATSEEKCSVILESLENFYSPLNIKVDVSHDVVSPTGNPADGEYWIFINLMVPTKPDQAERPALRQNYMSEVDKIVYGALERKSWRFDSFSTDQGQVFDCVLTKIFFQDEKVDQILYKKI